MKASKGETAWLLMELSAEAWEARMGCPQTYSCVAGAPSGGSHHFLPLWEHKSITPSPHLYLRSSEAQRRGFFSPPPTSILGKFPCGQ